MTTEHYTDSYIYVITALLPLVAVMLIVQVNPYHALVIRGILGSVAALLYTILGAADVALTEALVGTLLAMMLYAVAVRSSLVLRLGVLQTDAVESVAPGKGEAMAAKPSAESVVGAEAQTGLAGVLRELRGIFAKRYMRVDVVPFGDRTTLQQALADQEIHATCTPMGDPAVPTDPTQPTYHTVTRLPRLYDILQSELTTPVTDLSYVDPAATPVTATGATADAASDRPVDATSKEQQR